MYKSYSYSNMPEPVNTHNSSPRTDHNDKREHKYKPQETQSIAHHQNTTSRMSLQNDDIILIIIAAILLINGCDDKFLIIALAYIFFSGYNEKSGSITELLQ